MAKVILALGVVASAALGFFLWKGMGRSDFPPPGRWAKIVNSTGEPGALQVLGDWEDREAAVHLIGMAPPGAWQFMREDDQFRIQTRTFDVPVLGRRFTQIQWEIRRGDERHFFNEPSAGSFWGILGLIAGAPLVLAALAAGVVALASPGARRGPRWGEKGIPA